MTVTAVPTGTASAAGEKANPTMVSGAAPGFVDVGGLGDGGLDVGGLGDGAGLGTSVGSTSWDGLASLPLLALAVELDATGADSEAEDEAEGDPAALTPRSGARRFAEQPAIEAISSAEAAQRRASGLIAASHSLRCGCIGVRGAARYGLRGPLFPMGGSRPILAVHEADNSSLVDRASKVC